MQRSSPSWAWGSSRLGAEEKLMIEAFGESYEAYRIRTARLVPGLS